MPHLWNIWTIVKAILESKSRNAWAVSDSSFSEPELRVSGDYWEEVLKQEFKRLTLWATAHYRLQFSPDEVMDLIQDFVDVFWEQRHEHVIERADVLSFLLGQLQVFIEGGREHTT